MNFTKSLHHTLSINCLSRKSSYHAIIPGYLHDMLHTEELKTKHSNFTKKGKPSDHQDLVLAVTETLNVPPG